MGGPSFKPQQSTEGPQAAGAGPAAGAQAQGGSRQGTFGNAFLASQACGHDHDHGEDPNPGTPAADLNTTRPVDGDVPADVRDPLMASLRGSPRVVGLLTEIEAARGDLSFTMKWSDRGSYHRNGGIWLDRNRTAESWFGTMAHELVHLLTYVSGQAADAATMTREAFVNGKMVDEINAQAVAYVACLQTGSSAGGAGYDEFVDWLRANHPDLMVSDADAEVNAANASEIEGHARVWLEAKYRTEWTTSNTGENYYTYWGNYWDRVNPGR
jgi:hypothetical protein